MNTVLFTIQFWKVCMFDLSNELVIHRFGNGVKLSSPHNECQNDFHFSVNKMLKMPFNVFFTDTDGEIVKMNESSAQASGFISLSDALGRTIYTVAKKNIGSILKRNDRQVVQSNMIVIKEVRYQHIFNEALSTFISFKFPLYNAENELIGIFGCSIPTSQNNNNLLADSLLILMQAGLLSSTALPPLTQGLLTCNRQAENLNLTLREKDVLQQLSLGKTNKAIGYALGITQRTVDEYLAKLKKKLSVASRNELIEKTFSVMQSNMG